MTGLLIRHDKFLQMKRIWIWPLLLLMACNSKPVQQTYFSDAFSYCKTVKELNEVVKHVGFAPIVASRNYAYANIAAYECIAAGYPRQYQSLGGQLNGLPPLTRPDTTRRIDYHFAALLAFCRVGEAVTFPEGSMKDYVDSLKTVARKQGMPADMLDNSVAFAGEVSKQILAWSRKDHYAETRTAPRFTVIDTPGRWIPTPPAYASALEPNWNRIRPMVMDSASQFTPPPPFAFNMKDRNSDYYKQVIAVKNAVDSLTPEQQHIADFWDDLNGKLNVEGHVMFVTKKFSPPGHWMNIVGIAARKAKADFPETVAAYTLTAIAMFDAFIQCWDEKFRSNTVRPETVINQYIDPEWRPFLQTPPFPEYTCGHSTVSSAAAETLTRAFGDHFAFTDTSELEFGIASRSFTSFRQAAEENSWARFYGGIHFHPSCVVSNTYGQKVGELVVRKIIMKKP